MSDSTTDSGDVWSEIGEALDLEDFESAAALLEAAADEFGEDHPQVLYTQAMLVWETGDCEGAIGLLDHLLEAESEHADAHYLRALASEELEQHGEQARHFVEVLRLDTAAFALEPADSEGLDYIEAIAEAVLAEVPDQFREQLREVPVVLEAAPHVDIVREGFDPRALGLFEGLEHGATDPAVAPTRIVLFYANLLTAFPDREELADEIEVTLLHEIGHYFGLDEDEVERLGLA